MCVYVYLCRVGQNRISAPFMTVSLMVFPAEDIVYAMYKYGPGQPYPYTHTRICLGGEDK